ncbi:hypothetical protein EIP91_005348 [Steccherinum ochraceum]|uniref:Uncharacterized protein n=1 Tax=Steccherinum ochraceum TaxID=92696 RepID=A0A4R0RFN2_9APHY|nr:hypothetical protein EIP91_005348 [Steccherinum ochraceum]
MDPPVLHLPLNFPATSGHLLTTWSTITLHLPPLLPHFSSGALVNTDDVDDQGEEVDTSDGELQTGSKARSNLRRVVSQVPSGTYSHVSYVKVYATCRLRRIWFTEVAPGPGQNLPREFQLFGSK